MNVGKLKGIGASLHGQKLSRLLFADDTLLFGEANYAEARNMKWVIDTYEAISGQRKNLEKSGILFSPNTSPEDRTMICQLLGIPKVTSNGKYLGLPSEIGRNKTEIFQTLKTRVRQRIHRWSEKHMSKAGKEVLIISVIHAIPNYSMSCFEIPDTILEDIERMIRSFWWG